MEQQITRPHRARSTSWRAAPFNINSPIQLRDILFDRLGHASRARRRPRRASSSTAEEVLEELAQHHELPRKILDYRAVQKLKSHLRGRAARCWSTRETGRIHASLQPDGGRHRPPLRGRPQPAEHPHPHRGGPPHPRGLRGRARATCCSPPTTARSSCASSPTSRRTRPSSTPSGAARTSTTAPRARSSARSRRCRRTSSAASRRWSTTRCSTGRRRSRWPRTSGCRKKEAEEFIEAYFARYPSVRQFIDETDRAARARRAWCARCSAACAACPTSTRRNFQVRMEAERQAMNTPVQGSAADLIKKAMIDLHRELRARGAEVAAHPADPRRAAAGGAGGRGGDGAGAGASEVMEGALELDVPLVADARLGASWADVH